MKAWTCGWCERIVRVRRRWCLLYGPVARRKRGRIRVAVCGKCKKLMGVYA